MNIINCLFNHLLDIEFPKIFINLLVNLIKISNIISKSD